MKLRERGSRALARGLASGARVADACQEITGDLDSIQAALKSIRESFEATREIFERIGRAGGPAGTESSERQQYEAVIAVALRSAVRQPIREILGALGHLSPRCGRLNMKAVEIEEALKAISAAFPSTTQASQSPPT